MRIGDMQIDPLIDGEAAVPPEAGYANPTDWSAFEHYLDPCTGLQINTLGGFLVRFDDKVVLVDAGVGPKPTFPFVGGSLRSALFAVGVSALDVTDVIFTHLHADHIGWATVDGKPYFPNATYRADRRDWDYFCDPGYEPPDWERAATDFPVDAAAVRLAPVAARMEFFEGSQEIFVGIESIEASGHTPGSTVLRLSSAGEQGFLLGDLVHTQPELTEDRWHFWAHLDAEAGMNSIERVRKVLIDTKAPFAAAHFPGLKWGQLSTDGARVVYEAIAG